MLHFSWMFCCVFVFILTLLPSMTIVEYSWWTVSKYRCIIHRNQEDIFINKCCSSLTKASIAARNVEIKSSLTAFTTSVSPASKVASVRITLCPLLMSCVIKEGRCRLTSICPLARLPGVNLRFFWFVSLWFIRPKRKWQYTGCFCTWLPTNAWAVDESNGWCSALGRGWDVTDTLSGTEWQPEEVVGLRLAKKRTPVRRQSYHLSCRVEQMAGTRHEPGWSWVWRLSY